MTFKTNYSQTMHKREIIGWNQFGLVNSIAITHKKIVADLWNNFQWRNSRIIPPFQNYRWKKELAQRKEVLTFIKFSHKRWKSWWKSIECIERWHQSWVKSLASCGTSVFWIGTPSVRRAADTFWAKDSNASLNRHIAFALGNQKSESFEAKYKSFPNRPKP